MAKMKVHELAKELEIQSRDILAFLQGKGFDVKVAQSSIDEEQIALTRRQFGGKTASAAAGADKAAAAGAAGKASADKAAAAPAAAGAEKASAAAPVAGKTAAAGAEKASAAAPAAGKTTAAGAEKTLATAAPAAAGKATAEGADKTAAAGAEKASAAAPAAGKAAGAGKAASGAEKTLATAAPAAAGKASAGAGKTTAAAPAAAASALGETASASAPKSTEAEAAPEKAQQAPPKKKKIIIIGNSHNSKMPAGQRAVPPQRPRPAAPQPRPAAGRGAAAPGVRPQAENGTAPAPQPAPQQRPAAPAQGSRSDMGRKEIGRNESGREAAGRNQNGQSRPRPGNPGGGRPYRGGAAGERQGAGGGTGTFRGGANHGRPERRDDRPGNQFRKPQGGKGFAPDSTLKDAEKHRDEEKRRIGQEKDKRSKKDHIYDEKENPVKNRAGRFIRPEKKAQEKQEEQIKVITLPESITIKELAEKMKMQPAAIIKKLFLKGQVLTVNQKVDFETAENIAIEYDIICEKEVKVDVIEELLREDEEKTEDMKKRAPVICVMGHVDHGKTSLLDAIRKTNVTDREAGGITQHIGAYTVNIDGQSITFLDTPGHEAFTAMRMRGANATDIAILVVAADDGVMPQTIEAINHAKAAGIEIIVAVNKIDKPNANIDRVKQELAEYELISVDWGGTTEFVPVSAKTGEGINGLLETILLTAEILELKANPDRKARGLVIEAELDKGRGPVATVLVQKGTLHVGDFISAGASHGKVRAMIDDKGRRVREAGPSTPVEILGLSDVPNAGEVFLAHESDKVAKSFAETYLAQHKEKMLEETRSKMSLDDLFSQIQEGNLKELNLIVKADVQGSVEAVRQSLLKLSNEEVVVKCIHGGVGAINESDVSLASASNAIIIGFNVRPDATAKAIAEREGVDVRLYKVIYQAIEDVEAAMKGMLDPVYEEKVIGHAEVRQIFHASAVGNIAGSYVLDGEFQRGCKVRITREGSQIYEGALASLKRFKDDVKEVKAGFECGLVFEGFDQIQELDIVEAYIMVEVPR